MSLPPSVEVLQEQVKQLTRRCTLYESAMNALPDGIRITDRCSEEELFRNVAWKDENTKPVVLTRYHPCESLLEQSVRSKQGFARLPLLDDQGELHLKILADEQALHRLLDNMPQMVWIIGADMVPMYVNRRMVEYTGLSFEKLLLRDMTDFGHPDDNAYVRPAMLEAFKAGIQFEADCRYIGKDGRYMWFLVSALPLRDEKENITYWIGSCTNIDHSKSVEANLRRVEAQLVSDKMFMQKVINQLPVGLMAVHGDTGRTLFSNANIRETFHLPKMEIDVNNNDSNQDVGFEVYNIDGEVVPIEKWPITRAFRGEVVVNEDYVIMRDDRTKFLLRLSAAPVIDENGKILAGVVVSEDVTDRQKMIDERTTLIAKEEAALESVRLKSEFLANMSHEIRTPLNGVMGCSDLLMETELTHDQFELAQTIKQSGELLLVVISDILDFSKVEAGKLHLEEAPLQVAKLFEVVMSLMKPLADKKQTELRLVIDPRIPKHCIGDSSRLKQIALNVVSNAIKFTTGGLVTITVSPEFFDDDFLKFTLKMEVSDTGIGMDKSTLARLFQPFAQADTSTTRIYGGTGLGLSICRGLLLLMNGSISATSTVGKGSTFSVTAVLSIPKLVEAIKSITASSVSPMSMRKFSTTRVLVAEDNEINRKVVARVLSKYNVTDVSLAVDGKQACDLFCSHKEKYFDFVLMDCQMPILDGYQATRQMRMHETKHGIIATPIIALTASAMQADINTCFEAGMTYHISKPFPHEVLQDVIARYGRMKA